jgi:hypothetical protein
MWFPHVADIGVGPDSHHTLSPAAAGVAVVAGMITLVVVGMT